MRFLFTGSVEEVFPSILTAEGVTLVAQPGDVIVLAADPGHARLVPATGKTSGSDRAALLVAAVSSPTTNEEG